MADTTEDWKTFLEVVGTGGFGPHNQKDWDLLREVHSRIWPMYVSGIVAPSISQSIPISFDFSDFQNEITAVHDALEFYYQFLMSLKTAFRKRRPSKAEYFELKPSIYSMSSDEPIEVNNPYFYIKKKDLGKYHRAVRNIAREELMVIEWEDGADSGDNALKICEDLIAKFNFVLCCGFGATTDLPVYLGYKPDMDEGVDEIYILLSALKMGCGRCRFLYKFNMPDHIKEGKKDAKSKAK